MQKSFVQGWVLTNQNAFLPAISHGIEWSFYRGKKKFVFRSIVFNLVHKISNSLKQNVESGVQDLKNIFFLRRHKKWRGNFSRKKMQSSEDIEGFFISRTKRVLESRCTGVINWRSKWTIAAFLCLPISEIKCWTVVIHTLLCNVKWIVKFRVS